MSATAKYKDASGNALTYSVSENLIGGFCAETYFDDPKVELYMDITDASAFANGESGETANGNVTAFSETADSLFYIHFTRL